MAEITRDTVIDERYKVVSRLGTGGMADVFLAEDQLLRRKVAMKMLHRRFAEDPAFVERFRREAQAAAGLQQQNIVAIYDRGEFDGTYYIAMEYVPGRTLKEVIQADAPLDQVRAIDIAIQILRAARFAHRRGIVHRDLKPHNVIVDDSGDAKVTDFGIARAGASDMTETGSIMGTAQYLSPEQAQGRSVNAASDLYSVGVVLYEMLTGRVPFDGEQAVTIALKHVSEAPVPPRELNSEISPELEQTILWTLNKDPADRPTDADQLITVLQHCREAILAGAAGRHTAAMTAVAAGAAAGLPIEGLAELPPPTRAPGTDNSTIPPGEEPADPEGGGGGGWRPWLLGLLVLALIVAAAAAAYFLSRPTQVTVPGVVGQQFSVARTQLENHGFTVDRVPQESAKTAGTVIEETPHGNAPADKGSAVTLITSSGQGNVPIPSVQGESKSKAETTLKDSGLKVARTEPRPSSQYSSGDAIGTSPAAGTSVPHGYAVVLQLSSGPAMKAVSPVVGKPEATASSILTGEGFKVATTSQTTTTSVAGTVLAQQPGGNQSATPGSTVTLTVARAPAQVTVPPVVGDPVDQAFSALRNAGFVVNRTFQAVTKPSQAGAVLTETPAGSTSQVKGSTVTIVVGRAEASVSGSGSSSSTTSSSSSTTSTTSTTSSTPKP